MKKLILFIVFFVGLLCQSISQTQSIEKRLQEFPDLIFKEIHTPKGFEKTFELRVKQLVNHYDSTKGFFYQKVFLTHKGFNCPTVFITEGYEANFNIIYELTKLLDANQILIEHRYFGKSIPDSLSYEYLNLQQAALDLHFINQLFKRIYSGKWISTGISKGGQTAIFYKYFFPNDVAACVSYVAPLTNAFEDERIYSFLDTVGTVECRTKLKSFQIRLLENRDEAISLLKEYYKETKRKFTYLSFEQAFEYAVLEYPFSFWQSGGKCKDIPSNSISLKNAVRYLCSISPLSFFSDYEIKKLGPHYYQAASELGYYGYRTKDFKGLLKTLPTNYNPTATFLPNNTLVPFNDFLLREVHEWLENNGNRFIYIYGSTDTWTACAVKPAKNIDSRCFLLEGKNHYNARIAYMNVKEKGELIETLEDWLSIDINESFIKMFFLRIYTN